MGSRERGVNSLVITLLRWKVSSSVGEQKETMRAGPLSGESRAPIGRLPAILAAISLAVHLAVGANDGYFRDELYYMAAGRHLAFGYVDFPPFVAALAALNHATLGDALLALHFWPALAGALLVLLAGLLARELGGDGAAQGLASFATLVATGYLGSGAIFSMDAWDELWWALAAYVLARLLGRQQPRLWLLFGLVAGIGLLTKVTMLFWGFGLVVGLLLTSERVLLRSRWLFVGGAIVALLFLPYVLWNLANGAPTLAFWARYGGKLVGVSPGGFFLQQVLIMNPLSLPLWLTGLVYLLRAKTVAPYRAFGWAYLVLYTLFTLTGAKNYFLAPAYSPLFAAGAVAFERGVARAKWTTLRRGYAGALAASGLLLAPLALPILPPPTFGQVFGFLGGDAGVQQERHTTAVLPQWLADRYGWPELVGTVARVHQGLPTQDQSIACIFTGNYGEAGAVDFFGPRYGLPPAISGHNNYFLWGPDGCSGAVVIAVGVSRADLATGFGDITQAATVSCDYCMPYENDDPVFVARQPKLPIKDIWPRVRHFD
jgi:4-amino-4-deoxy-L-arabinose transferase-like glycosyltransferase